MVFIRKLVCLKKILLFYFLFSLNNKNIVCATSETMSDDDKDERYSQMTISDELGLTENDNVESDKMKANNNPSYYPQPYPQPYPQTMPIILTMAQPGSNQNETNRTKKKIKKKINDKVNKTKEKYLNELKAINDKNIFSNNYSFDDFKGKVNSYRAFTFNLLSVQMIMLIKRFFTDKSNYDGANNVGNSKTWTGFLQDEFTSVKKPITDNSDILFGPSAGFLLKIARVLSNVKWEWKSIKNKYFAVGFELAHFIFPTCLLEFNTGYDKPKVFGGGIKIGVSCGLGIFFTGKINNFYIKVDGPCLSIISMYIGLRNSTLKNDESKMRGPDTKLGGEASKTFYNKFIRSLWTFERVNTGYSDSWKNTAMVDIFESISFGLGWIFPKIELFEQ